MKIKRHYESPRLFNVIVVREAPHVIMGDRLSDIRTASSPCSLKTFTGAAGAWGRRQIYSISGSVEELLCVDDAWSTLTAAECSLCFRTAFGWKPGLPPSHTHNQTHSHCSCSNCTEEGWGWAFTYCWHRPEKATGRYGDSPPQFSIFIAKTSLEEIILAVMKTCMQVGQVCWN